MHNLDRENYNTLNHTHPYYGERLRDRAKDVLHTIRGNYRKALGRVPDMPKGELRLFSQYKVAYEYFLAYPHKLINKVVLPTLKKRKTTNAKNLLVHFNKQDGLHFKNTEELFNLSNCDEDILKQYNACTYVSVPPLAEIEIIQPSILEEALSAIYKGDKE